MDWLSYCEFGYMETIGALYGLHKIFTCPGFGGDNWLICIRMAENAVFIFVCNLMPPDVSLTMQNNFIDIHSIQTYLMN
jgi:hypothetical protein